LRSYRRYAAAVSRLLRQSGAQVVHANDPLAFQLAIKAAKRAGAKILLNLRDTLDPGRRPPRLKFGWIFKQADHLLFLSNDMAERWAAVAAEACGKFSVTYSIVDLDRYAPQPLSHEQPPVILVPGVFWPKKGQLAFIRHVVPTLAEQGLQCWFAGDFDPASNNYAATCAEAAEPFGDRIRFLGFRHDMPELYARSAAVAVPSRHEGLMRGMIEAMSCGRPVVSFDVCSASEMLAEADAAGVVVSDGDFSGMARALIRFATDAEHARKAGSAGRRVAEKLLNPAAVIDRYEHTYRLLEGRS
jgi:glycosyltransferase involved in cell wall biosynthesis